MPYCSIDEAWGPSFDRGPKNTDSRYALVDKSKNWQRTNENIYHEDEKNDRYYDGKNEKTVELKDLKKTKKVSEVEPYVLYENRDEPVNRSINFYDKYQELLRENRFLKEKILELANNNPNAQNDLCLYIFTGIFIIYILDIFTKIGKNR